MSKQYLTDTGLVHYHNGLSRVFLDKETNEARINNLETAQSNYDSRLTEVEQDVLQAIGVNRRLQELVKEGQDAIANLDTLETTLEEVKTIISSCGIEVTNYKVTDLPGYLTQLSSKISTLQTSITTAEAELEELL